MGVKVFFGDTLLPGAEVSKKEKKMKRKIKFRRVKFIVIGRLICILPLILFSWSKEEKAQIWIGWLFWIFTIYSDYEVGKE